MYNYKVYYITLLDHLRGKKSRNFIPVRAKSETFAEFKASDFLKDQGIEIYDIEPKLVKK